MRMIRPTHIRKRQQWRTLRCPTHDSTSGSRVKVNKHTLCNYKGWQADDNRKLYQTLESLVYIKKT